MHEVLRVRDGAAAGAAEAPALAAAAATAAATVADAALRRCLHLTGGTALLAFVAALD